MQGDGAPEWEGEKEHRVGAPDCEGVWGGWTCRTQVKFRPTHRSRNLEGALAAVRAQCKLGVYLGPLPVMIATIKRPPGKNQKYPEAFGIYWFP